ncbi:MAG: cytochrome P450, partial [Rivularia sp. (in: cyanobacteria)]
TFKTPSFLQKVQWIADPVAYMEKAARQYPDIYTAEVVGFGNTLVFVNHPKGIEKVFSNDSKEFVAVGETNKTFEPIIGEYGLVTLDGDRHKRQRKLMMPSFHGKRMHSYAELMCDRTNQVFANLPANKTFSVREATLDISLEIILGAVFGLSEGERYGQIKHLLVSMLDGVASPLTASFLLFPALQKDLGAWSIWGKFVRLRKQLDDLIYAEIAERHNHPNADRIDVLSMLMQARDEEGQAMTDKELRDDLITVLFAGHETSSSAISWALYWIHHLPEVGKKLLAEIDNLGENPDPMEVFRLPYLTAICSETIRLCPVTMTTFPRVVQEPVELLGHNLEPGTVVVGGIYNLHRREDLYPEPTKFKPERFLERQYSNHEFLGFGAGSRRCIGEAFAMFEMKLVITTILSKYQLQLADDKPETLQRHGAFNLAPANGVKMSITRMRQPKVAVAAASQV